MSRDLARRVKINITLCIPTFSGFWGFGVLGFDIGTNRYNWSIEGRLSCLLWYGHHNLGIIRLTSIQSIERGRGVTLLLLQHGSLS